MNIVLDTTSPQSGARNAGPKARLDADKTLSELGYQIWNVPSNHFKIGRLAVLSSFYNWLRYIWRIKKDDNVIVHYPLYFYDAVLEYIALKLLCLRCKHVSFLIHDIIFLREGEKGRVESRTLNLPSMLLAHTPSMKDTLSQFATKPEIKVLYLFDYYSSASHIPLNELIEQKHSIAFAGNLGKSVFLRKLQGIHPSLHWKLYGNEPKHKIDFSEHVEYCGRFSSDDPSILRGGWGLVWDGDSVDTCDGEKGNYMRYNSPHKVSLYLSCGMPVIIWSQSALAEYVTEHRLGIAVDSLHDICEKIDSLTGEEYGDMAANAEKIGQELKQGKFLTKLLTQ